MNAHASRTQMASWLLAGMALVAVLKVHLLSALLAGLLVFELVHLIAPRLQRRFASERGRTAAVALLAALIVGLSAMTIVGALSFFRSDAGNLAGLFARMATIIEDVRAALPGWLIDMLPPNAYQIQQSSVEWLLEHAAELQTIGREAIRGLVHVLIGMVIGAMISSQEAKAEAELAPLAAALAQRAGRLADAFRRVVFAQVRISALNTTFTAAYLMLVLPLFGVQLPLSKTLIAITFLAGLLPVVGNLISNTVIVVISLAHSPQVAAASLSFLVVIHKLEYFLNARIVGSQINARAWELLTAMLLMEAVFGLPGLVAAPIAYAWVKDELTRAGLI